MTERYQELARQLKTLVAGRPVRHLDEEERQERAYLIVEMQNEIELEAEYDAARDECIYNDPTGQDLDAFYGDDY